MWESFIRIQIIPYKIFLKSSEENQHQKHVQILRPINEQLLFGFLFSQNLTLEATSVFTLAHFPNTRLGKKHLIPSFKDN